MRPPRWIAFVAAAFMVAACTGDSAPSAHPSSSAAPSSSSATGKNKSKAKSGNGGAVNEEGGTSSSNDCPAPKPPPADASATLTSVGDRVTAAAYPLADHPGNPWSQWGQGVMAGGRFWSAVGDECGVNADSYVYSLDPSTATLRMTGDVLSVVDHQPGTFGYGKIHANMVRGADDAVYATTYWGTRKGITYGNGYEGDVLLRIDPATGRIENLGVPVPHHGVPALAGSLDGRLLFGEAADPVADPAQGVFFVYDLAQRKVIFQFDKPPGAPGYRNILVDGSGKAWFSTGDGEVSMYDPSTNQVTKSDQSIPGQFLRAASHPAPDGTVYGVTEGDTDTFFKVSKDGKLTTMNAARGYTTSIALTRDGKTLYYVPDAHGKAYENGTPVIALDTATGNESVVVKLNDLIQPKLGARVGGSYDIALDDSDGTLFVGLNAGAPDAKDAFGSVVLAAIRL